jgi:hypothetical protein
LTLKFAGLIKKSIKHKRALRMKLYQYKRAQNSGQTPPGLRLLRALFKDNPASALESDWPAAHGAPLCKKKSRHSTAAPCGTVRLPAWNKKPKRHNQRASKRQPH